MSDDLDTLRQAIDALDDALLKQLNERAKLAQRVAEAKQKKPNELGRAAGVLSA
jgi:chorismate mutase